MTPPRHTLPATVLILFVLAGPALAAGRTTFYPSVQFDVAHSDNIAYQGDQESSDTSLGLTLTLPVSRQWQTSSLDFSYAPSYRRYNRTDALDDDEHRLTLGVSSSMSRNTELSLDTSFQSTQSQGNFQNLTNPDVLLTRRTRRQALDVDLGLSRRPGASWSWDASIGAGTRRNKEISGFASPGFDVEDSDTYRGQLGFSRTVSRKTRLGGSYGHAENELEITGDESIDDLSLTINSQISRRTTTGVSIGAFRSELTSPGGMKSERNGLGLDFNLGCVFRTFTLAVQTQHRPTTGGYLIGAADQTTVGLSLANATLQRWNWRASAFFARRDPALAGLPDIDTLAVGGSIERQLPANLGLTLGTRYFDQQSGALAPDSTVLETSLGLIWYPRGHARGGQRT